MKDCIYFKDFKYLNNDEILLVYNERNKESIRQLMANSRVFSLDEHKSFVESLKYDNRHLYYLVYYKDEAVAVFDYRDIDYKENTYETGCYFFEGKQVNTFDVTLASVHIQLEKQLYYPRIRVKKGNEKALIFNVMKMQCEIIDEDSEYYYLKRKFDINPKDNASLADVKSMLKSLSQTYELKYDI